MEPELLGHHQPKRIPSQEGSADSTQARCSLSSCRIHAQGEHTFVCGVDTHTTLDVFEQRLGSSAAQTIPTYPQILSFLCSAVP